MDEFAYEERFDPGFVHVIAFVSDGHQEHVVRKRGDSLASGQSVHGAIVKRQQLNESADQIEHGNVLS